MSSLDANIKLSATFKIQQKQGGTYVDYIENGKTVTLTTGEDGTAVSGYLPAGEYQLVEISVSGTGSDTNEYAVDPTPIPFAITAGQTNTEYTGVHAIPNDPMRKIRIDKFESWDYENGDSVLLRQDGVTFEIYDRCV